MWFDVVKKARLAFKTPFHSLFIHSCAKLLQILLYWQPSSRRPTLVWVVNEPYVRRMQDVGESKVAFA